MYSYRNYARKSLLMSWWVIYLYHLIFVGNGIIGITIGMPAGSEILIIVRSLLMMSVRAVVRHIAAIGETHIVVLLGEIVHVAVVAVGRGVARLWRIGAPIVRVHLRGIGAGGAGRAWRGHRIAQTRRHTSIIAFLRTRFLFHVNRGWSAVAVAAGRDWMLRRCWLLLQDGVRQQRYWKALGFCFCIGGGGCCCCCRRRAAWVRFRRRRRAIRCAFRVTVKALLLLLLLQLLTAFCASVFEPDLQKGLERLVNALAAKVCIGKLNFKRCEKHCGGKTSTYAAPAGGATQLDEASVTFPTTPQIKLMEHPA